ncbi:threonine/serine exporter family protein [Ornithinibacillus sp. BX22]|uniref:Threonine/serine exporter family protein n=3 Tax=Bacillaceae TaxID=186817 RepID=A0A923RIF5_9BACI|nr:threonine/serine exporter family protein [Ornithinibacillus hominis]MBS3679288.1 threonine/serine exporter family protein [Ornithinibacillus massiliensis]
MLAGKIMLESSAETYRVEDTMNRIARAFGLDNSQSYATPTAINFSIDIAKPANMMRIEKRTTDLNKIAEVNSVSRKIASGELNLQAALKELQQLEGKKSLYSNPIMVLIAALASGSFTIMFGGLWADFIPSFLAGGIGFIGFLWFDKLVEIRFISEFVASFMIGLLAALFIQTGIGVELDKIIIGAVMPLVPGLHITNAVRDLLAGHLVAGLSKGVEALLTAFAIGAGIAVILAFI